MSPTSKSSPAFSSALSHEPADKRIEILRLTGDSGSISQAARDAGVSYKAAWQAIDTLTNLAGVTLVERAVGGSGGGGATLTAAGRELLAVAGRLTDARRQLLAQVEAGGTASFAAPALSLIGLRTSMRNQLPCTVTALSMKGQVVRVTLQLAGGEMLVSRITRASAELLGLQPGLAVIALCKATAVKVTASAVPGAAQALHGQAARVSRGATGDEVSLQLEAGLQLVGFAPAGSGLKARAAVSAQIDESALVIALPA